MTNQSGVPVNNSLLDPLQGFDADVWVLDQATGNHQMIGRFTSVQITVRNATEPYLEFNQRIPRYLDGDLQIGWTLERGLIDVRVFSHTFGSSKMTRETRMNRSPRFQITFNLDAPELQTAGASANAGTNDTTVGNGELFAIPGGNSNANAPTSGLRIARGAYVLWFCKTDTFTMGAMAGRSVIATRWEGLSEGIEEISTTSFAWAGEVVGGGGAGTIVDGSTVFAADRSIQNLYASSNVGFYERTVN